MSKNKTVKLHQGELETLVSGLNALHVGPGLWSHEAKLLEKLENLLDSNEDES